MRGDQHGVFARILAVAVAAALVCLPVSGHAVDKAKAAAAMVKAAAKAYEAADYARAAELYRSAWLQDPKPAYLWALARAEHLGGQADAAVEHYQQFIAAPGSEAARVPKARDYLAQLEAARSVQRVREADQALAGGDARLAASLYLDAYRMAPGRPELLFKAGVAEQAAGQWAVAEAHFVAYLKAAPTAAGDRAAAEARLEAVRRKFKSDAPPVTPEPVAPTAPPTVAAPVAKPAAAVAAPESLPAASVVADVRPPDRTYGWVTLLGGAALAAGGIGLYVATRSDLEAFRARTTPSADGLIDGTSHEEATADADAINTRIAAAAALGVVGVVAATFGAGWLARNPGRAAVVPAASPGGVGLAWHF